MAVDEEAMLDQRRLSRLVLQDDIEQFYYEEAAILDDHRYADWIELFTDDTHYFMPIRRTRTRRELDKEFTKPGEMAYFDDDKMLLNGRVLKFLSGTSWAEDPPSRTRHMIHNVRIVDDRGDELDVEANFHIYRTRLKSEEDAWVGKRCDTLRRDGDTFKIAKRWILLDQTVLLARNLSTFF
jgi:3-phenylpropionate/cinnamic acid dioxygenase small subunit